MPEHVLGKEKRSVKNITTAKEQLEMFTVGGKIVKKLRACCRACDPIRLLPGESSCMQEYEGLKFVNLPREQTSWLPWNFT